jgi:anti-sigma factor RsiW
MGDQPRVDDDQRRCERIDAYLEGRLSPAETAAFERELAGPALAAAFAEAIALRDLLAHLPPEVVPAELIDRLAAIGAAPAAAPSRGGGRVPRFERVRAAAAGASWAVRGPSIGVSSVASSLGGALTPLRLLGNAMTPARREAAAARAPLWRRALGLAR